MTSYHFDPKPEEQPKLLSTSIFRISIRLRNIGSNVDA